MIELKNLSVGYKNNTVIEDISLELDKGIYVLIGPNGAGKSTLMKTLATLLQPKSGNILYNGKDLTENAYEYRSRLGYLPQEFEPFENMKGKEYLHYIAECKGIERASYKKQADELFAFVGLTGNENKATKKYSVGMKKRLGVAQALLGAPDILIMDEPTAGLDPEETGVFRRMLSDWAEEKTILISSHIIADIDGIANQAIFLKDGKIHDFDNPNKICSSLEGRVFYVRTEEEKLPDGVIILSKKREDRIYHFRIINPDNVKICGEISVCKPNLNDYYIYIYGKKD